MPKATAVWLVEKTGLTFLQIAEFTGLHPLEIQSIADDEYAFKIRGLDPIIAGQLTAEEIKRCEADPEAKLKLRKLPAIKAKEPKKKKYTPLIKRQERPDAIYFLIRKHPELTDAQICKLIGTTKNTVQSIRDKTHWKTGTFETVDPVTSGFCTQIELSEALRKAEKYAPKPIDNPEEASEKLLSLSDMALEERAPHSEKSYD